MALLLLYSCLHLYTFYWWGQSVCVCVCVCVCLCVLVCVCKILFSVSKRASPGGLSTQPLCDIIITCAVIHVLDSKVCIRSVYNVYTVHVVFDTCHAVVRHSSGNYCTFVHPE